jgi:hypothetical protein
MADNYTLTIHFRSDDRPPTWDIIKGTPNVGALPKCCLGLGRTHAKKVESFTLARNGELPPEDVLADCVEIDRWPPKFPQ